MSASYLRTSVQDPPDWFDLDKYAATDTLDFEGWRAQVFTRISLEGLLSANLTDEFDLYFGQIQNAPFMDIGFDINYVSDKTVYPLTYGVANAIVDSLSPNNPNPNDNCDQKLRDYGQDGFVISAHLTVDLDGSKEEIIQNFQSWLEPALAEYRTLYPRAREPGITQPVIRSWHDYQVLPYQDLKLWYRRQNIKMPSDTVIATWLFAEQEGDKNKALETRNKAAETFSRSTLRLLAIAQSPTPK
jgi:hypothetical protein